MGYLLAYGQKENRTAPTWAEDLLSVPTATPLVAAHMVATVLSVCLCLILCALSLCLAHLCPP